MFDRPGTRPQSNQKPITVLLREVDMMQGELEVVTNLPGILQVLGGCAVAVVVFPVGHMQRMHIPTTLLQ